MGTRTNFVCSKCGRYEVAHRKGKNQCKECEGTYLRDWKKRTGKQKDYNIRMMEKRAKIKQLCIDYLGGTCQYDGGCLSPVLLDAPPCCFIYHFHHRDPKDKIFEISRRFRKGGKFAGKIETISDLRKADPELVEELDKCILLCSNCHHRLEYCDSCDRGLQKVSS
ncbi:MAG: hypothetical protein ACXAC5_01505 [Promethearchaeota archaeon]|jgi:hypothetical protein